MSGSHSGPTGASHGARVERLVLVLGHGVEAQPVDRVDGKVLLEAAVARLGELRVLVLEHLSDSDERHARAEEQRRGAVPEVVEAMG